MPKGKMTPKREDEADRIIAELLKKDLGPQSGSYAGAGRRTVQQGREESRRGKPAMGISKKDIPAAAKNIDKVRLRKLINKLNPGRGIGKFLQEEIFTMNPKTKLRNAPGNAKRNLQKIKERLTPKSTGLEEPIAMSSKGGKLSRKKGGTVSRKKGSKIMYDYKAGGKV